MKMASPPSENQPCPLQFYNFSQLDHKQHCPVFTALVEDEEQGIVVDNIDNLKSEFMALQHNVQNRINLLESELLVLDSWQVKREYTRKPSISRPPERKIPKFEGDKQKLKHSKPVTSGIQPKEAGKEQGLQDISIHKTKGDAPDRFWASVEPYCAPITESDLQMLQDGIRSYEKREELFHIPPLGQHYSHRWALEDLREEQGESLRLGQKADPLYLWDKIGKGHEKDNTDTILKDAESLRQTDKKPQHGPLTERLLAAFLEDPVSGGKGGGSSKSHGPKLSVQTGAAQVESLETRIKNELIGLGLFDPPEPKEDDMELGEDDEILAELKKKQAELTSIMEYNCEQREILLSLAQTEMKKEESRKALQEGDDEIIEWLKKVNALKQKRKTLGRKERETIWKLLENRNSLVRTLD